MNSFKKTYFSKKAILEINGNPERAVFFGFYKRDDNGNVISSISIAPQVGEIRAIIEGIEHFRKGGPEAFNKFVAWMGNEKGLTFFRKNDTALSLFVMKGETPRLGLAIKRGDTHVVYPFDSLNLLSFKEILEKKALPIALDTETTPKQAQRQEEHQEQGRFDNEDLEDEDVPLTV